MLLLPFWRIKIGRKLRFSHTPPAFDAPVRGAPPTIAITFSTENYNDLPDGKKSLRICLLVSIQYTNVTDGQAPRDGKADAYNVARQKSHSGGAVA